MDSPSTADWSYHEAFDRNIGLITVLEQQKLRYSRVAIIGLGGVGGIYATSLARLGVGKFTIADPDIFERVNTNRQQGATVASIGKNKAETVKQMIKDINPTADVRVFGELHEETVSDILDEVTLALDGLDFFAISQRRTLYRTCRSKKIPVLGAAPIGFGSSMLNFDPNGMSFDDYFSIDDTMSEKDQVFQFALGISPLLLQRPYFAPQNIDFAGRRTPSSVLGTLACANLIGCETFKVLTGQPYESAPVSWQFDPFVRKFRRINLRGGNRNVIQILKKWYYRRVLS